VLGRGRGRGHRRRGEPAAQGSAADRELRAAEPRGGQPRGGGIAKRFRFKVLAARLDSLREPLDSATQPVESRSELSGRRNREVRVLTEGAGSDRVSPESAITVRPMNRLTPVRTA